MAKSRDRELAVDVLKHTDFQTIHETLCRSRDGANGRTFYLKLLVAEGDNVFNITRFAAAITGTRLTRYGEVTVRSGDAHSIVLDVGRAIGRTLRHAKI